ESVEENANLVVKLLIRRPECFGPALRGEGGQGLLAGMKEAIKISEDPALDLPKTPAAATAGSGEEEKEVIHMGNAIMSFYSALIDLLGRCAPEMHVRLSVDNGTVTEPDMSACFCPDHKAPMVLFLDRVYGIEDQSFLLQMLEVGFLPDLKASASLDTVLSTTETALAMNRYIGSALLPLLTRCAALFGNTEHYAQLVDSTLETIYRLSKGRSLTKAQRDAIEECLLAICKHLRPSMMQQLLRRLVFDVPMLTEYCKMPLRLLTNHYEQNWKYYCLPSGMGGFGMASEEELLLTKKLFWGIFDSLSQKERETYRWPVKESLKSMLAMSWNIERTKEGEAMFQQRENDKQRKLSESQKYRDKEKAQELFKFLQISGYAITRYLESAVQSNGGVKSLEMSVDGLCQKDTCKSKNLSSCGCASNKEKEMVTRTVMKSGAELVKVGFKAFFENAAEDLEKLVEMLKLGKFMQSRAQMKSVTQSINYVTVALLPILTALFEHITTHDMPDTVEEMCPEMPRLDKLLKDVNDVSESGARYSDMPQVVSEEELLKADSKGDNQEAELLILDEFAVLCRDLYAFYPMLIRYVDNNRSRWLKKPDADSTELFRMVAEIFILWCKSNNFKREEQNFVIQNEINNLGFLTGEGKSKMSKSGGDQERKHKRRRGEYYSIQTSLIVAALKKLLPIGLNMCTPGDQELISLAKIRYSLSTQWRESRASLLQSSTWSRHRAINFFIPAFERLWIEAEEYSFEEKLVQDLAVSTGLILPVRNMPCVGTPLPVLFAECFFSFMPVEPWERVRAGTTPKAPRGPRSRHAKSFRQRSVKSQRLHDHLRRHRARKAGYGILTAVVRKASHYSGGLL
ncbi:hypothetical protein GOODEAATRI_006242, partial [Goodea atripinnis]